MLIFNHTKYSMRRSSPRDEFTHEISFEAGYQSYVSHPEVASPHSAGSQAKTSFAQLSKECKNLPLSSRVRLVSYLEIPEENLQKVVVFHENEN